MTTQPTLVPAIVTPDFDSFAVRQAIAGFLAGYGDATRDAYSLDLRQWLGWCTSHDLKVFEVKRAHIELFARSLEQDVGTDDEVPERGVPQEGDAYCVRRAGPPCGASVLGAVMLK